MMDRGLITGVRAEDMYVSYLVCALRSLRFGHAEAHGKGYAIQLGLLMQQGTVTWDGARLDVDLSTIRASVESMARTILEAQGAGDKAAAVAMSDKAIAAVPASLFETLGALRSVPVDVTPTWPALDAFEPSDAYLKRHGVQATLKAALGSALAERPADPLLAIGKLMSGGA